MESLISQINKTTTKTRIKKIKGFTGKYSFLANDYEVSQESDIFYKDKDGLIDMRNQKFLSVEHAYQASKTLVLEEQMEIANTPNMADMLKLSESVTVMPTWDKKKDIILKTLVNDKFVQNFPLKIKLVSTDPYHFYDEGEKYKDYTADQLCEILLNIRNNIIKNQGSLNQLVSNFLDVNNVGFISGWINFNKAKL
jgi:predicted NAD-dependent protein-ADP-ribosyltransferase YbiA (DUF1768 family)